MIDYNILKEQTRQKFEKYDSSYFNDYFDFNRGGSEHIATSNLKSWNAFTLNDHQKTICAQLTVATSVMDRIEYLLESLKTWLKFPFKKIVIVDWSSKVSVKDVLIKSGFVDPRIEIITISKKRFYDHSEARNEKMRHSDGWVLSIDSDVMLTPLFANCVLLRNKKAIYMNDRFRYDKSLFGTTIFHKDEFDAAGGCTPVEGWGAEDYDLFERMKNNGCNERDIRSYSMKHIPHSDFERTKNTKFDDIYKSLSINGHETLKRI